MSDLSEEALDEFYARMRKEKRGKVNDLGSYLHGLEDGMAEIVRRVELLLKDREK